MMNKKVNESDNNIQKIYNKIFCYCRHMGSEFKILDNIFQNI